jgi:Ser/Thr protein kinase RdoA (MazF antagonist)
MSGFYGSSTEVQVQQLEVLARAALIHWGFEDPALGLLKYRENAVFGARVGDARYAVRIHRPGYHSDAALTSELAWMEALSDAGIHTPPVVHTTDGRRFVVADVEGVPEPRQVDVLGWVDGEQIGTIEGDQAPTAQAVRENHYAAGRLSALIHNHSQSWTQPAGFVRHVMDGAGLIGEHGYLGNYRELGNLTPDQFITLDRAREVILAELSAFGQNPDRFGLVHGDFLPENLLRSDDDIRIIDFDDCGFGWHVMDMATSMFFLLGEPEYEPAFEGFVAGYRSERDLPEAHLAMLPTFLLARGMTYLAWIASRPETETAQELAPVLAVSVSELAAGYLETHVNEATA